MDLSQLSIYPGTVDITVNGVAMRCHLNDNWTETDLVASGGKLQGLELPLFLDRLKPGDTVIDVGANAGLYTLLAAQKVGPTGYVVAIEPNRTLVERLKFNIDINGFAQVAVAVCAVGETSATRTLKLVHTNLGTSTLHGFKEPDLVKFTTIDVPVRTLAQVLADFEVKRVDAMKMDIEGYEDRALLPLIWEGPKELWPKVLLIETHHGPAAWQFDVITELEAVGYRKVAHSDHDAILELA